MPRPPRSDLVRTLTLALGLALSLGAAPLAARAAEKELRLDLGRGTTLELVLLEPGVYFEGSPADEIGRGDDENEREVTISRGFYAGKYPVTRGQFARFAEATGYKSEAEKGSSGGTGWDGSKLVQRKDFTWRSPGFAQTDDHPVCLVTHDDAVAFCAWLSTQAKRDVRLPTEAQWEYACRAGTRTRFPSGDGDDEGRALAWCKENAGQGTRPVGQKSPNPWGLFDMCGNVHQWCRDWYGAYEPASQSDPEATSSDPRQDKPRRVMRGGSWNRELKNCRAAARSRNAPGSRNADNGFRVVAAPEATKVSDAGTGRSGGTLAGAGGSAAASAGPSGGGPSQPARSSAEDRITLPSHSGGSVVGGLGSVVGNLVCCGGPIALVVYMIFGRGSSKAASGGGSAVRFTAKPSHDGFWLTVLDAAPGSSVSYECTVNGARQTGTVVVEPGPSGQFVYTGGEPSVIGVTGLTGGAGGAGLLGGLGGSSSTRRSSGDSMWTADPPTSSFGGFPRAY